MGRMPDQPPNPARDEAELFRLLVENVQDYAIFVIDLEGQVASWNPGAERLLDYREDEILGQSVAVFFTPEDIEQGYPRREMQQALEHGRGNDDRWHVRKDGSRFWCGGTMTPLWDENHKHRGFAKIMRDRTEWKRNQDEALFHSALLDQVGQAVVATKPDGTIIYWNRFAEALYGWAKTDVLGRNVQEVTVPQAQVQIADEIMALLATGQSWSGEFLVRRSNGATFPAQVTNASILDEQGQITAVVGISSDISEQKTAEGTLRHSEERFRSLMEQAPFSIQVFAPDGRTLRVNRAWEDLWGLRFAQIADYNILEDRQLDAKGVLPHIRRAFAGEPSRIPGIYYDPNETIPDRTRHQDPVRWVSAMAYPLKDETGKVREVVLVHEDTTQQRKAEEALQRTEERLRLIIDSLPTLISYVDSDGIYRLNNRAYEDWFRQSRREVTGRHMRDVLGDPAWSVIRDKVESALSGDTVHFEAEVDYKDAGKRWIDATYVPHFDSGRVVGLFVLVNDITDRKKAEEVVRQSEALFRNLADNAPAMLWVTDPTGYCNYLSALWYEYTGRTSGEDVGDGWLQAIHPDDLTETKRIFKNANEGHRSFCIDYRVRRYDGEYRWAVDAGLPRFENGIFQCFVGCVFDVHERKLAEDANTRLVAELRDADQRKDEFLATLAHELRNPLAPIRNSLQILKMPQVDAATSQLTRDMIERQVHHLVRLVDDLLDVSRVMRGKIELRREPVEIGAVVARAVEMIQPLVENRHHVLEISVPDESLLIDGDPVRLAQIVANLLANAAKYTEPSGYIWLSAERSGDEVVLRVRDNGIGISPEMLPRVFDLFVQADHATTKAQGGLGIGLTLVKNLVQLHGGTVVARSLGFGKGSEFVVRLPLMVTEQAKVASNWEPQQEPASQSGLRLLVVDDNHDAAMSLAMLLRLQGHGVRVAHNGPAALEIASNFMPDVVFLDIGMPEMDGYEVARRMRRQLGLENVVLAAVTGWGQFEDRLRTSRAGFDHHVVKPPDPKEIANILDRMPNRQSPL